MKEEGIIMPHPVTGRVTRKDLEDAATLLGVELVDEGIKPGDLYLAGRNTGPHLLTCKNVDPRNWINAVEPAYSFDTWECVKVVETARNNGG